MTGSNNTISTLRRVVTSGKEVYDTTNILVNEPCFIAPISPMVATILDNQNAYKMFEIIVEGQLDIKIGDKCIDGQAVEYIVKGIAPYQNNQDTGDIMVLTVTQKYP